MNSLRQISLSNPIALLRSENTGEKPPKANWLLGILGVIILVAAYYTAVTIESPVTALAIFFVAVCMVIIATYLLFIAGSVIFCRLLQKNKRYYYKANHFVSVSSMVYRMKRNGAGLASICILLTMVLVMLSSTAALYIGTEDVMNTRYPRDINMKLTLQESEYLNEETLHVFRERVQGILDEYNGEKENIVDYYMGYTNGIFSNGEFMNDEEAMKDFNYETASEAVLLNIISLSDYNRIMGEDQLLLENEVLIYPFRTEYTASTFQMNGGEEYQVKEVVEDWIYNGNSAMTIIPSIFVIVPEFEAFTAPMQGIVDSKGNHVMSFQWLYGFDLNLLAEEQVDVYNKIRESNWMRGLEYEDIIYSGEVESLEEGRNGFYTLFGGLFYIGILLSIVFLFAAVLIIYYKQVSEGYEDQSRFEIMQKVGMTKKDIRRSINSQMLTVFFLPLLMAGVHLCFAFPVIRDILYLFNLWNTEILVRTSAVCFAIFGLFYAIVYRITSNSYFKIVSGARNK